MDINDTSNCVACQFCSAAIDKISVFTSELLEAIQTECEKNARQGKWKSGMF